VRLEAKWLWDGRIVGTAERQVDDDIFTVMEGLTVPTKVSLIFPVYKAHALMSPKNRERFYGVPVMDMTQIRCEIDLTPDA
jgi:hypothetical protein